MIKKQGCGGGVNFRREPRTVLQEFASEANFQKTKDLSGELGGLRIQFFQLIKSYTFVDVTSEI